MDVVAQEALMLRMASGAVAGPPGGDWGDLAELERLERQATALLAEVKRCGAGRMHAC